MKRENNSLLGIDGALMLMSLVVFCVSLYFFFQDDGLRSGPSPELSTIGQISGSHNDVRRKIKSGFSWSNITGKDVVYEGDSIFTGEDSDAAVTLDGGSQLHVDPQSLVVVRTHGTSLQLDLQYGSMVGKVNRSAPLLITQNGKLQEISGNDAEVRIETSGPDQETTIQVVRGEVELQDVEPIVEPTSEPMARQTVHRETRNEPPPKPHKSQTIKQNQVLDMKPKEQPVIRSVAVQLVSPEGGKSLWLAAGEPAPLTWKIMSSDSKSITSQIEFARDKDFTTPFFTAESTGHSYQLSESNRPQGEFLWRVKPKGTDQVDLPSTPNRLTLYADLPPTPVFPADHQEFALPDEAAGKSLLITWEDHSGSNEFDLQIAKDVEFKNSIVGKRITTLNFQTADLEAGAYFWRVRGLNSQRKNPPWSQTLQFAIEEEVKTPLAPHLAKTQLNFVIPDSVLKVAPTTVSVRGHGVPASGVPPFTWTTVANAQGYEVEIAETESFENSIKQTFNTETTFAPQEVKPGALFVRVRAKGKKGLMSESSEVGRLDISLPPPELAPVPPQVSRYPTQDALLNGNHTFKLSWSERRFAETYEIEWGTSAEFDKSKKFRVKTTDHAIKVTRSMDYAARVRALGPNGIPLSEFSSVQIASYKKELLPVVAPTPVPTPVPLPPVVRAPKPTTHAPASISPAAMNAASTAGIRGPLLLDPKPSSSYVTLEDSLSFVNFVWRPVGGAQGYELQIAQDADFTTVLDTLNPSKTSITLKKALPEGKVFWRVRAKLKNGPTEWSDVFNINVLYE